MFRILIGLCIIGASLADPVFHSGVPMPDGRIVGGEDADIREFPHQISMRYRENHRCGGSLVASNIVVSAAHCLSTLKSAENLTIVAGSTTLFQLSPSSQTLPVRKFIIHDKYKTFNNDNDAAILFLDGDFEFNEFVQPIPLAKERPENGTPVFVTGWGVTKENGLLPNILQKVVVKVVENTTCKKSYPILLTGNMLCSGEDGGGKDACQGDSGGPLIYNKELLGIVSWGTGCARPKYPGVYASVPEVRGWIEKTIKDNEDFGSIDFL
ncbi:vitellin-degrading protease-like [Drosophila innubila]|uniref:vitellin-degrading protease-like n=1 Tax=Drosophila innubila TaxID=198719 RepID=UPI00148DD848|nr:vitellin-degrading protease-like [Drosophila innubila]